MLIIIEGPDASGKTSLARSLAGLRFMEVHHHGPYPKVGDVSRRYLDSIRRSRGLKSPVLPQGVVMDRSWYSEPIYGRVKRAGQDRVGIMRRVLEREALGAGGVLVLSRASFAWTLEKWRTTREEQYVQEAETHQQVWHEYQRLSSELPTVEFDPEESGVRTWPLFERITTARIENHGPGIGCFRKGVVLVVEDWPWHDQFVEESLDSYGISERDLYWVAPGEDPSFLERLEPERVLAVGEGSDEWCQSVGIENWMTIPPEDLARALVRVRGEAR